MPGSRKSTNEHERLHNAYSRLHNAYSRLHNAYSLTLTHAYSRLLKQFSNTEFCDDVFTSVQENINDGIDEMEVVMAPAFSKADRNSLKACFDPFMEASKPVNERLTSSD